MVSYLFLHIFFLIQPMGKEERRIMYKSESRKRIISLDITRFLAIFLVILTHASDNSYQYTVLDSITAISPKQRFFALTLHILGRSGVPLFLFLSGYLLLDRDYERNGSIITFWKKHLLPLILTCSIWGLIYYIYGIIIDKNPFSLSRLITELIFYKQYEGSQFWYIPMILGMYLFIPIVGILLKHLDSKIKEILFIISFLYIFIPPMMNPILKALQVSFNLQTIIDLSFSGNAYGLLILMGYFAKRKYQKVKIWKWFIISISCFLFLLWEENLCFTHGVPYDLWYNNIVLAIMCFSIFKQLLKIKIVKFSNAFTWISRNSFGIFLVHNIFIKYLSEHILTIIYWRKFFVLFIVGSFCSIIFVFLIGLNKQAARLFLYKK